MSIADLLKALEDLQKSAAHCTCRCCQRLHDRAGEVIAHAKFAPPVKAA